ncbi:hypothetical protein ACT453_53700, partial [Bacillus sp. D-CC]
SLVREVLRHEELAVGTRYNLKAEAARMVGGFASSYEVKSTSTSEAPSPSHSERAASAFKSVDGSFSSDWLRFSRTKGAFYL